jgi:hypothetical protein
MQISFYFGAKPIAGRAGWQEVWGNAAGKGQQSARVIAESVGSPLFPWTVSVICGAKCLPAKAP